MTRRAYVGFFRPGSFCGSAQPDLPIPIPQHFSCERISRDCAVFATDDRFLRVSGCPGVVFGEIYRSDYDFPIASCEELERLGTKGIEHERGIWGNYVSIFVEGEGISIYRSAMGRVPCYYLEIDGWFVFFSDLELIRGWRSSPISLDWPALAFHMLFKDLRVPRTCLVGLNELTSGHVLHISKHGLAVSNNWSPWDSVPSDSGWLDEEAASDIVRRVSLHAIKRLASPYRHIVLGASGGLDSSIVACALAEAGKEMTMVNLVTRDPRGDERQFVRALANHLGSDLIEMFEDVDLVDLRVCHSSHLPRPLARAFAQSSNHILSEVAYEQGADAHFTGGGGDNAFCFLQSATPVADLLLKAKISRALRCASDLGTVTGAGTLKALRLGVYRAFFRTTRYRWPKDNRYLQPEAIQLAAEVNLHPWLALQRKGMPGSCGHVASLLAIENHLEGFQRELIMPVVSPLMAKPIIDAALKIPPWMWYRKGINRSVARDAFAGMLPEPLISRSSKGTPGGFAALVFHKNRETIRELLCGGLLASEGMVDVDVIHRSLADGISISSNDYILLLSLCDVESWCRSQVERDR